MVVYVCCVPIYLVAMVDVMFNGQPPYSVRESDDSLTMNLRLSTVASQNVTIMITIENGLATGMQLC